MDCRKVKILFYFTVLCVPIFAATLDDYPLAKNCFVQYLHEKGKLDEPISTVQPSSRCRLVVQYLPTIYIDGITGPYAPKAVDCLKNELTTGEYSDYLLKWFVLQNGTELEETNRHIENLLANSHIKCKLNVTGAVEESSLADHQLIYCVEMYVFDNQLLDSKGNENDDRNPHKIDTKSLNCTQIIADERSKTEMEFKDRVTAGDCAMNEFRSGNLFDWKAVVTTYMHDYVPGQYNRIHQMVDEFLAMPTSECVQ